MANTSFYEKIGLYNDFLEFNNSPGKVKNEIDKFIIDQWEINIGDVENFTDNYKNIEYNQENIKIHIDIVFRLRIDSIKDNFTEHIINEYIFKQMKLLDIIHHNEYFCDVILKICSKINKLTNDSLLYISQYIQIETLNVGENITKETIEIVKPHKIIHSGISSLIEENDPVLIPKELHISTITFICKFPIEITGDNFTKMANELVLKKGGVKQIQYLNIKRSIIKNKKEREREKSFNNRISILVDIGKKREIRVRITTNGTLQMSGIQNIDEIIKTIEVIGEEFQNEVWFEKQELFDINYSENPQINMINSNFRIPFNINLEKLSELVSNKNIECRYDQINHSCVHIKYLCEEKQISIFCFEKGSIVITGCKNYKQIRGSYEFIYKFLYSNYKQIVKKNEINISNIITEMAE